MLIITATTPQQAAGNYQVKKARNIVFFVFLPFCAFVINSFSIAQF
jgi:hypothetical protein